jgi:Rod binding domain-containing protein
MSASIAAVVNAMAPRSVKETTPAEPGDALREAAKPSSEADAEAPADPKIAKLEKAARQFEAIFVRQLLKTAKFGGKSAKAGHGQMAVDAMANSICEGGGLGLSAHIRDALVRAYLAKASGRE